MPSCRCWQAGLTGIAQRAHAAHLNSFEAFPLFATAVIVARLNGADQSRVDALSVAFVGLRLIFGILYLADKATMRSVVWLAAMVCWTRRFSGSNPEENEQLDVVSLGASAVPNYTSPVGAQAWG